MYTPTDNTSKAITPSPSTAFAKSLKTHGDITYGKKNDTRRMIVRFNKNLFITTCYKASDGYDETKCIYDDVMTELFKSGQTET